VVNLSNLFENPQTIAMWINLKFSKYTRNRVLFKRFATLIYLYLNSIYSLGTYIYVLAVLGNH